MKRTPATVVALLFLLVWTPSALAENALYLSAAEEPAQTPPVPGRKNVLLSFALSAVAPSAGQFYNGEKRKGLVIAGLFVGGVAFHFAVAEDNDKIFLGDFGVVVAAIAWAWSMFDAPSSAYRINQRLEESAAKESASSAGRRWEFCGGVSPRGVARAGLLTRF